MEFLQLILALLLGSICTEHAIGLGYIYQKCELWEDLENVKNKSDVFVLEIKNQSVPFMCDYPALKQFPNLQVLSNYNGTFTGVTEQCFEGAPKLKALYLQSNLIQEFDLRALNSAKIKYLVLDWNSIRSLDFTGVVLPQLKSMTVLGNLLTEIDIDETNCPNMSVVTLNSNQISRFHIEGNQLSSVLLKNNSIRSFNWTDLKAPNLQVIDLSDNQIIVFPTQLLSQFPNIDTVYFKVNVIEIIDLTSLNISRTKYLIYGLLIEIKKKLISFQITWSKVTELKLSFNSLETLEFNFEEDLNVEKLLLNNNRIEEITSVDLKFVSKLLELDLSNNLISEIQNGSLDQLTKLQILNLGGNNLQMLPKGIFDQLLSIVSINLSNNELRVLPLPGWDPIINTIEKQSNHVSLFFFVFKINIKTLIFCSLF